MDCDNIVIVWMNSARDDTKEITANVKSIKRKNEERQRRCHVVEYNKDVASLKDAGSIGMYIVCHTSDFDPGEYVKWFAKNFADSVGQFKKISVACCRTALDLQQGKLKLFLNELKDGNIGLPEGLKVCGFTVALTTFDIEEGGFIEEKYKPDNPDLFKQEQTRQVGSVQQDGMKLKFLHEKLPLGGAVQFIEDIERLFSDKVEEVWVSERSNYIKNKVNANLKVSKRIKESDIASLTWKQFLSAHCDKAKAFVNNEVWRKFETDVSTVNEKSAKMWTSLVNYVVLKKAFKFKNGDFIMIELSEYTDKPDMRNALDFVRDARSRLVKLTFVLT